MLRYVSLQMSIGRKSQSRTNTNIPTSTVLSTGKTLYEMQIIFQPVHILFFACYR